ncbi:hypothetical protein H920_12768 [Fukomys damarensis]|uniref:Uncharacterized protein n=1 Tax=Fukomys damarensis TaxID=885580 RepID=A0A091D6G8_FUKDA|nr:hypothetical protein H920_12768 [Fukomys damarensis]
MPELLPSAATFAMQLCLGAGEVLTMCSKIKQIKELVPQLLVARSTSPVGVSGVFSGITDLRKHNSVSLPSVYYDYGYGCKNFNVFKEEGLTRRTPQCSFPHVVVREQRKEEPVLFGNAESEKY